MRESSYGKGNIGTFPLEMAQEREDKAAQNIDYLYPLEVMEIQKEIVEACDKLEYDGSFMYDAYPDKVRMEKLARDISGRCDCDYKAEISNRWFGALVQMMLCNEMSYRRRRRECHKNNMGKSID
ncbi:MAG: hypothetical protein LUH14_06285 [Clostridiaceae bacterium]|nr:hypothetical protein [Clostridiaceae bacterium]